MMSSVALAVLIGKMFDLVGNHGKAFAYFASPGHLDGGIEGEQVGLGR